MDIHKPLAEEAVRQSREIPFPDSRMIHLQQHILLMLATVADLLEGQKLSDEYSDKE